MPIIAATADSRTKEILVPGATRYEVDNRNSKSELSQSGIALFRSTFQPVLRMVAQAMRQVRQVGLFSLAIISYVFANAVALASTATDDDPSSAKMRDRAKALWSFQPLAKATPPQSTNQPWIKNPIDAFIASALEKAKLTPKGPANKVTLLRRVYFDLIGLPPSPEQIEAFVKDKRPEAYAEVIEQLLASQQYGERWGRHWLDVARYADTGGFEQDYMYQNGWKYRDYVIRSFNADKPFDRFIHEQVAGDELWPDDPDAITATSLYSIGPVLQESAMISTQLEYEWLTDSIDLTGAAFMGLTVGCARCHDHKYDPVSQKDYFAMQAIFAASDRPYPDKIRESRLKVLNGFLAEKPLPKEFENDPRCTVKTEKSAGLRLLHRDEPMEVRLLRRGELSKPRDVVQPAFLSALGPSELKADFKDVLPAQRRAVLAKWLTSPEQNPLTSRAIVNRVWGWHFGEGLVRTPNDFGNQGDSPTHPELLDWLAREFVAHGWRLKELHRLIMSSSAYQMDSVASEAAVKVDPENRLLSHFPRRRLNAEAIWDAMHATAGTLNCKQFGPPVVPKLTKDELTGLFQAEDKWKITPDITEHNRRAIYMLARRIFLVPMFDVFDPPEVMTSCGRRMETVVPTQALALLNSEVAAEQSRAFAARLQRECSDDQELMLSKAWLLAFNRQITNEERERARAFLGRASSSGSTQPLSELCLALFNTNEFVYVD